MSLKPVKDRYKVLPKCMLPSWDSSIIKSRQKKKKKYSAFLTIKEFIFKAEQTFDDLITFI